MNQPTPAIVAQNAVRRLPRIALLLLCAAYLMPGLIGRGPWKTADIVSFGYMAELARATEGISRWFDPSLLGLKPETPALVPYWIGALAIKLAPAWLNPDLAVRIAFALLRIHGASRFIDGQTGMSDSPPSALPKSCNWSSVRRRSLRAVTIASSCSGSGWM